MNKLTLMRPEAAAEAAERWRLAYWPVGLIVGSTFLARSGANDPASLVGEWSLHWPWLVVGWWLVFGAGSLLTRGRTKPGRAEAGALAACVLAGAFLSGATHLAPRPDLTGVGFGEDLDLYDILGENFQFIDNYEWTLPEGESLEVENSYGSVRVTPSPDGHVHLQVRKSVRASSLAEAAARAPDLVFSMDASARGYVVSSNRAILADARLFRSSLEIAVPMASPLTVVSGRGAVDITGMTAGQTVYARDGGVRLRTAGGPVGTYVLRGNVRIVFERPPSAPLSLSVDDGDLRLELPPDSAFEVDGTIRDGSFGSDFPGVMATGNPDLSVTGQVGGSPPVPVYFQLSRGRMRIVDCGRWIPSL